MAQGESGEPPGARGLLAREWPFVLVCAGAWCISRAPRNTVRDESASP